MAPRDEITYAARAPGGELRSMRTRPAASADIPASFSSRYPITGSIGSVRVLVHEGQTQLQTCDYSATVRPWQVPTVGYLITGSDTSAATKILIAVSTSSAFASTTPQLVGLRSPTQPDRPLPTSTPGSSPLGRTDPSGTSFIGDALDAVSKGSGVENVIEIAVDVVTGNLHARESTANTVVSGFTTAICAAGVIGVTGGVGTAAAAGCGIVGTAAGLSE